MDVRLGHLLAGMSYAFDLAEGRPAGHTARSCLIGMRLAHIIGLRLTDRTHLYYALLLKDAGSSAVATRPRASSLWTQLSNLSGAIAASSKERRQRGEMRSEQAAQFAASLGLPEATAAAVRTTDEHWDGSGEPRGLRGAGIPLLGRIIALAQATDLMSQKHDATSALEIAEERSGHWFDPDLVRALRVLARDLDFWRALQSQESRTLVLDAEPDHSPVMADAGRIDAVAEAFGTVIDARSRFTHQQSQRVAVFAATIAKRLGFRTTELMRIRRAALLHDIGMLAIPNSIIDKPAGLSAAEWSLVYQHPRHTLEILRPVPVFQDFAFDAACHHERLDRSGYPQAYAAERLSPAARVLAVADVAGALLAARPYRPALDPVDAARFLQAEARRGALCPASVVAVTDVVASSGTDADSPQGGEAEELVG